MGKKKRKKVKKGFKKVVSNKVTKRSINVAEKITKDQFGKGGQAATHFKGLNELSKGNAKGFALPLIQADKTGVFGKAIDLNSAGQSIKKLRKEENTKDSIARKAERARQSVLALENQKKGALQRLFRGRRQNNLQSFLLSGDNIGRRTLGGSR